MSKHKALDEIAEEALLTSTIVTQERLISARQTEVNQLRGKLAEAEADLEIMKRALASFTEALALVSPVVPQL